MLKLNEDKHRPNQSSDDKLKLVSSEGNLNDASLSADTCCQWISEKSS